MCWDVLNTGLAPAVRVCARRGQRQAWCGARAKTELAGGAGARKRRLHGFTAHV